LRFLSQKKIVQPIFKTLLFASLFSVVSCESSKQNSQPAKNSNSKAAKVGTTANRATAKEEKPPPVQYDPRHDEAIKEIFALASKKQWVEAETRANQLAQDAPGDEAARRIQDWVCKQGQAQQAKAVEDKIREIDMSKDTTFNPTPPSLAREGNQSGLPPRKDVREAVQKIEATPYIPDSFGKTVHRKEALIDLEKKESAMSKLLEKEISVHLDNVTLEAIIFNIGQTEGINFVADKSLPAFKQSLSVNMNKVKLGEFLRYVARNLDVQFQVGDDLIWIVDAKDPKRLLEETRVYHLKHGFIIPAQFGATETSKVTTTVGAVVTTAETFQTKKFVNDGAATNPAVENAIKQFFAGSKYQVDYERNLVLARGTADQLLVMDEIIDAFDKPLQQVLIEARFITISEAAFLQLGVNWEAGGKGNSRQVADFTGLGNFGGNDIGIGAGIQQTVTNKFFQSPKLLSQPDLTATLTALQQSGESQTLSAPRLTLVNNLPAMINDGQVQYYYEEYAVQQNVGQYFATSSLVPSGKPTKITAGVSLYVLASIGGDGKNILLALNPQVNQGVEMVPFATVSEGSNSFVLKLPQYRTQELATRVVVKSGETVAMGGVLEREQTTLVESVPLLSRIPVLGALFRKRTALNKPRYLLIFVTATLLSENGEFVVTDAPPPKTAAKK